MCSLAAALTGSPRPRLLAIPTEAAAVVVRRGVSAVRLRETAA